MDKIVDMHNTLEESYLDQTNSSKGSLYLRGMKGFEKYKKWYPYFLDLWQYVLIILIMLIAALFIL